MTKKTNPIGIVLFIWCILCVFIYIYFSAGGSFIQSVNIYLSILNIPENIIPIFSFYYWWNVIFSLFGICLFAVSCISFGKFILSSVQIKHPYSPALLATWFLVGSALYSIIFLLLASAYKLTATIILFILFVGIVLDIDKNIKYISFVASRIQQSKEQQAIYFRLNIILLFLALLSTSARISYDSSAIYFSDAKLTAYLQNIQYFKEGTFVASAFQNSILFSTIMKIFGEQSARMLSWVAGVVIIIFVLTIAEKLGATQKAQGILLTLLLTSTAFIDLFGDGKVDLINSAYSIAVVYWMVSENENQPKHIFILIGFLAGMSIIGRLYNIFLFTVFTILYYFQKSIWQTGIKQFKLIFFLTPLIWIFLGAFPLGLYHLLVNWLIQGNAFSFLSSLSSINSSTGPWDNKPETMHTLRLLYPFVATFRNTPQSLGNISPLVIGLLPFWLIPTIRKTIPFTPSTRAVFWVAFITLTLWIVLFFTVVEIRYVFFLWFILLIPASQLIESVLKNVDAVLRNLLIATFYTLLIFMVFRTSIIIVSTYSPLDEHGNPQCKGHIVCESAINPINNIAPLNERVLSLSAYRYYLRNDLFFCSSTHEEYHLLQTAAKKNTSAFWYEVVRQGYQYIAYEFDYTMRHLQLGFIPAPENTPSWLKLEKLDSSNKEFAAAYKLISTNPPVKVERTCKTNLENLLEVQLLP